VPPGGASQAGLGNPWKEGAPDTAARERAVEIFQRLNTLEPGAVGAEDLTPEERPFLRFEAAAQELFDGWRAELEHRLRAEEDHPVLLSHLAKYRSLLPSLALLFHLIDGVDTGRRGPVSRAAAAQSGRRRHMEVRHDAQRRDLRLLLP